MEYKIEKCTEQDMEWLYNLHERTMREYVDKVYGWDPEREKRYFHDKAKLDRYHLILDEADEKIGALNFVAENDVIRIFRIEVLPDFQNRGIGSMILDKIIERARKEGKNIELRVLKVNPAHKLYSRRGFKVFKESDKYFYMRYENK
jgi:ribosomal protein S18 acetylase RimI-like enzyme